ncbi:MAG: site-specific integrase [Dorea sp.]|nr:site-specific integrase [Dorea sp.]MCI9615255.1 site-specific integrase [Dorea sp.]
MSKRGENIYKRKDGRWEGRYIKDRTAAGKAVYGYVYARSYKETRLKLQNAVQMMRLPAAVQPAETKLVHFHTLAEEWFSHIRPLAKESTYRKYWNLWNSYICPELGEMRFVDITQDVLEDCCNALLTSGGQSGNGLSAKTVSDALSLIRNIFRYFAGRKFPIPCDTRAVMVKQTTKEMRIFSLNEQKVLCSYIRSDLNMRNVGVLLCLLTGIRVGEVCALRWEDISFPEKTMHIHQTMQRIQVDSLGRAGVYEEEGRLDGQKAESRTKIIVTTPKSKCSIRTIPIPEELFLILQAVRGSASGYFLTGSEKNWVEPRTMQNHFKKLLKCCAIEDANYHALRHTFATRCVELGFDVKSLSEILGHASVNITMNRYVHPSMQLKQANMQRLSEMILVQK